MDHHSCFILMPFSKADELDKEDLDYIYSHIIKKVVEEFEIDGSKYFQRVERFESKIGSIISGIVKNLNTADLVIADLTSLNPNVMYELGVRHSLKRGTIIISQNLKNLPSDLRDYLTVGYSYSKKTTEQVLNFEKFRVEIHKTIKEVISTEKFDSPVLSYLQQKQRFRDEEEVERLFENAIIIKAIYSSCYEIEGMINQLIDIDFKGFDTPTVYQLFNLKLNNLNIALSELRITYSNSATYDGIANSKSIIGEVMKLFSMNEYFDLMKGIEGFPSGIFGADDIKSCIEKPIIDVFQLSKSEELVAVDLQQLFETNGVLHTELMVHLENYLKEKSKELDVDYSEVEDLINPIDNS